MTSDNNQAKVVRRKVRPYPISAILDKNNVKIQLDIMMLSPKGFIGKLKQGLCYVGMHYMAEFEVPISRFPIKTEVQVFKTFDRSLDPRAAQVERMVEVLFLRMSEMDKGRINSFLSAIGQN